MTTAPAGPPRRPPEPVGALSPGGRGVPAGQAGTEFADIVCADPDLLRQEFDALIAASYARPPARRPPAPPGTAPRHGRPQPPAGPGGSRHPGGRTAPRPGRGHSRQRSPPP